MGHVDIVVLHKIYRKCVDLEKENNWNFRFKEDSGDFETMIEFTELVLDNQIVLVPHHPPLAKNWDDMELCNAPDIMDYDNRIIIEFEEEAKPQKGPKIMKKGHWAESKKDSKRDERYEKSKFRVCKIWQSELKHGPWELKLFYFLSDCFTKRKTFFYQYRFISDDEIFEHRRINL